jgi:hypothetical protein
MNVEVIWLFYAGILAQAIFLISGRFEGKDVLKLSGCCAASGLLGLIPGKHETHYDLKAHLFYIACLFVFGYAVCFKEKVLERIDKEILMVWTLVGLFIAAQTPLVTSHPPVLIFFVVLSLVPVVNAFAGFDQSYGWKVYFYIWFLIVLVGIAASKFAFSTVANVFGFGHHAEELHSFEVFIIGMSFLYLAVNLWFVIELIPLPGKHQSFSERLEQVREDMDILAGDYDARQVRRWKAVLLLTVSSSLLAINYFRHFVSNETLIPILIVALPLVERFKLPSKTVAETVGDTDATN